jgi:hypothetical protein
MSGLTPDVKIAFREVGSIREFLLQHVSSILSGLRIERIAEAVA